jgi:RNA polymerase sigma-70 factor (ECF subfamily)
VSERGEGGALDVIREQFGFVPRLFRAQAALARVVDAQAALLSAVLTHDAALSRAGCERLLLAAALSHRSVYCATLHYRTLLALGAAEEELDRIVAGDSAVAFADPLIAALGRFLCTVAARLGVEPDFAPLAAPPSATPIDAAVPVDLPSDVEQALDAMLASGERMTEEQRAIQSAVEAGVAAFRCSEIVNLSAAEARPSNEGPPDPDAEAVARVRGGDVDAFEGLVLRHSRTVYRTLLAILGNAEEARDAMQDTFLKAFEHLGGFERRAKFSTWLISIASNTGLQRLRDRRSFESLDETGDGEGFRPRQVRAWTDDPEQEYAKSEMRALVESSVMRLPVKYRSAVMLRDVEQLPAEEAAAALGLGVPAFKSRLLRGRLMLREALAPHFSEGTRGVSR